MTVTEPWTCPTCGRTIATPYCAECGERPHDPRDLTLRGLLLLVLHAFTSVDGKVLRSVQSLLARPGALSLAFVRGQRTTYVGPFQLFFLANVAFFGLQSLTHANVFSSTLDSHLHHQDWSALAQRLVQARLEARHTTLAEFAPLFDRAVALHAKSLVILMVVPFALFLPLVFRKAGKSFVAHTVFALHLFTFLLLVFCASLALIGVSELLGGAGLDSPHVDTVLSLLNLGASWTYLLFATQAFYGSRRWALGLQSLGLVCGLAAVVLGYRFACFWITLYST